MSFSDRHMTVCTCTSTLFILVAILAYTRVSTAMKVYRPVPAELLRCWRCENSHNCQTMKHTSNLSIVTCELDEPFCTVLKLQEKDDMRIFRRDCTHTCNHGCQRTGSLLSCTYCCSNSLCNTDTAPSHAISARTFVLILLLGKIIHFLYL
ncbi:hypothetical protein ScPMuIL_004541 [Solemya velum]